MIGAFNCFGCGSESYFIKNGVVFCSFCGKGRKQAKISETKQMKTCKDCKWYSKRVYHVHNDFTCVLRGMMYPEYIEICECFERKTMSIEKVYEVMQEAWVELYNVEVGDVVKVLRTAKTRELGWVNSWVPEMKPGRELKVTSITKNNVNLENVASRYGSSLGYPFYVLEPVKKAEPVIEITIKVNGKESKLSDISKETLLNIREKS